MESVVHSRTTQAAERCNWHQNVSGQQAAGVTAAANACKLKNTRHNQGEHIVSALITTKVS